MPRPGAVAVSGLLTAGPTLSTDGRSNVYALRVERVLRGAGPSAGAAITASTAAPAGTSCDQTLAAGHRYVLLGDPTADCGCSPHRQRAPGEPPAPLARQRVLLCWPSPAGLRVGRGDMSVFAASARRPVVRRLGGYDVGARPLARIMRRGATVTAAYRRGLRVETAPRTSPVPARRRPLRDAGRPAEMPPGGLVVYTRRATVTLWGPGGPGAWRTAARALRDMTVLRTP